MRAKIEPAVPWFAFRIYFRNLYDLVTNGRGTMTKVLAGSVPPETEDLWTYARNLGFNTDLLHRVEKFEGGKSEQGVDEMLHLKMSNAVHDYDAPQIMALLTGDGKVSDYGTSFPDQVKRALKRGWDVEVYSWTPSLSKNYQALMREYPTQLKIVELDTYYEQLTFVKGGEYYRKEPDGTKVYFTISDRFVKPLR
jgi:hypothetical protein